MNDIKPSNEIHADLVTAKMLLESNSGHDEAIYNIAAYHTEQAVEKSLKYYLRDIYKQDESERRFKTHDIPELIRRLEDEHGHKIDDELKKYSETIYDWAIQSRYGHCLVSTEKDIKAVLKIADGMLSDILNQENSEHNQNIEGDEATELNDIHTQEASNRYKTATQLMSDFSRNGRNNGDGASNELINKDSINKDSAKPQKI